MYFHDKKNNTVYFVNTFTIPRTPKATKKNPRPAPTGWTTSAQVKSISASVGPRSFTVLGQNFSVPQDTEESATTHGSRKLTSEYGEKITKTEYERLRQVYEEEFAAKASRKI